MNLFDFANLSEIGEPLDSEVKAFAASRVSVSFSGGAFVSPSFTCNIPNCLSAPTTFPPFPLISRVTSLIVLSITAPLVVFRDSVPPSGSFNLIMKELRTITIGPDFLAAGTGSFEIIFESSIDFCIAGSKFFKSSSCP